MQVEWIERYRRVRGWLQGHPEPPYEMDLNITERCNLKCIYCWTRQVESSKRLNDIDDSAWIELVRDAIDLGVGLFSITGGGEPYLRRTLIRKIIPIIRENERLGQLTTNGTLMESQDLKLLVKHEWTKLVFSIDGPTQNTHNGVRGRPYAFRRTVSNLQKVIALRDDKSQKHPEVDVNFVLNRHNLNNLEEMVELCSLLKINKLVVFPLLLHNQYTEKLRVKETEKTATILKQASRRAHDHELDTNLHEMAGENLINEKKMIPRLIKSVGPSPCYEPFHHISIRSNGEANPCCTYNLKTENVIETPLKEIWYGTAFQSVRDALLEKKLSMTCAGCSASQVLSNMKIGEMVASVR